MAIYFNNGTDDRVEYGDISSNQIYWSICLWIKRDSGLGAYQEFVRKEPNGDNRLRFSTGTSNTQLFVSFYGNGTGLGYETSDGMTNADQWYFFGVTIEGDGAATDRVHFYRGDLSTVVTEVTATYPQDNSISSRTDTAAFVAPDYSGGLLATIAFIVVWPGIILTEADFRLQQFSLHRPAVQPSSCKLFTHLGVVGESLTPASVDWSGNANNGTTGGTPAYREHVPIPIFPPPIWSPPIPTAASSAFRGGISEFDTYNENLSQSYPTAISLGS